MELWSPDGKSILFVSEVYPDCNDDACNKQRDDEQAKSKVKAKIFTQLMFRHWNHYFDGKYSHLFVVSADGGVARDLTPGAHDVPPFSLGGQDQYQFSPDGQEVAFTSNIDEVQATSTNSDVFIVPVAGGTPKKITTNPGSDGTPMYSPDGKYIAYRSQLRGGYESDRFRLMLYERATGKITDLTPNFDRWVDSMAWSPDSKTIYFTAENEGEAPIYQINITAANPWPQELVAGFNDSPTPTPDGKTLLFDRMSIAAPNEIYSAPLLFPQCRMAVPPNAYSIPGCLLSKAQAVTNLNESVLSQVEMQPLENFWFTGAAKERVQGFIVKPPNFDASKKYPVKFLIHGGPQGAWGDDWSYRWNPELFAANGYVVIMVNFHGSTGYGQKFVDAINGDWGGAPFHDLMLGLDYAEKTYPFVDKDRECALGASYGGYAINWIEGHTDSLQVPGVARRHVQHRVSLRHDRGAVVQRVGVQGHSVDQPRDVSQVVAASVGDKLQDADPGGAWPARLPARRVGRLPVVHHRAAARRFRRRCSTFPDEGHWVLKPQNSRLWYQTVNDWVDEWTKGCEVMQRG